ncbi:MAG: hypothetical protein ACOYMN_24725 [Roseimicrobium sp.]
MERLKVLPPLLKHWFTNDWEAKLVALVLAFLLWYVVKDQVARSKPLPVDYIPMRTAKA